MHTDILERIRSRAGGSLAVLVLIVAIGVLTVAPGCGWGCGGGGAGPEGGAVVPAPAPAPAPSPSPSPSPTSTAPLAPLAALAAVQEGRFATSLVCARCHANSAGSSAMRDADGAPIAPFDLWRSSMMANAARDPLWRAMVSTEVAATPSRRAAIEAKCTRCHAPMASAEAAQNGEPPTSLDLLAGVGPRSHLALDGVACAACHQILAAGLGTEASYTGGFLVGERREAFGPHAAPFANPMIANAGFTPVESGHVTASRLCATCHTLFTDALRADGSPTGHRLPEQTPYLEWRNSDFNDEGAIVGSRAASCQSCHVPTTDAAGRAIATRIAARPDGGDFGPVGPRAPYGRHVFVGGNTLIPQILRDNAGTLRPNAPPAAFDRTIAEARRMLRERSATIAIGAPQRAGDLVTIPLRVENLAGHKLPTAHPIRRAWLRVRVTDAAGATVLAVGEHDAAGRILGSSGAPLASERAGGPIAPHLEVLAQGDQVLIYESVMADEDGAPTFHLLRGTSYLKDNRLLPLGWSPAHPDALHTAPRGLVTADPDFAAGEDTVVVQVAAPLARGPYRLEATLLYQTLGARFAAELLSIPTPEVESFRASYERADRTPETVAEASASF